MAPISRIQVLSTLLSVIFLSLLGLSAKMGRDREIAMKDFRSRFDTDGNANLSAKEVGLWFHKTFSNTSVGDKKSEERFAHLIAAFDVDHDGSFDDAELKAMFDVYDEHPAASDELKVLGGDDHDTVWIIIGLLGLAGVSTIFLLYSEAFKTARFMNQLEKDLRMGNKAVKNIEGEMKSLEEERAILHEKIALEAEAVSLKANSKAAKEASAAEEARIAAAAATARLHEVEERLERKAAEAAEAKNGVAAMKRDMEEKLSEYTAQNERLAMMQQCLHFGLDKYSSEGASTGFAVQGGHIFGSLGGATGADMYTVVGELGAGRRGAFKVKSLSNNQEFAMKQYDLSASDKGIANEIMTELSTNQDIGRGHPNIVQYEKVIETERYIFVLMELVGRSKDTRGVDLFDFISVERGTTNISESEARGLFKQLVFALSHLHGQDVIHGDIKPENAMVVLSNDESSTPILKLIDFGCACFLRRESNAERNRPIYDVYSPPEVVAGSANAATLPGDMYRLGATLFTMLVKCPPSQGIATQDRINGAFCQQYRWKSLSIPCKDIITKLLSLNPNQRPTCAEVLAHPWVVGDSAGGGRGAPILAESSNTTLRRRSTRTTSV